MWELLLDYQNISTKTKSCISQLGESMNISIPNEELENSKNWWRKINKKFRETIVRSGLRLE